MLYLVLDLGEPSANSPDEDRPALSAPSSVSIASKAEFADAAESTLSVCQSNNLSKHGKPPFT